MYLFLGHKVFKQYIVSATAWASFLQAREKQEKKTAARIPYTLCVRFTKFKI